MQRLRPSSGRSYPQAMREDQAEALLRGRACSVARTVELVGDRWSLLVLRELFYGVRRFERMRADLDISRTVLAGRLRHLVDVGLVRTTPYRDEGARERQEYRLTRAGVELLPAIVALMQWGDRHLADEAGPPVVLRHADCGAPVEAELRCAHGHAVAPAELRREPGPGAQVRAVHAGAAQPS